MWGHLTQCNTTDRLQPAYSCTSSALYSSLPCRGGTAAHCRRQHSAPIHLEASEYSHGPPATTCFGCKPQHTVPTTDYGATSSLGTLDTSSTPPPGTTAFTCSSKHTAPTHPNTETASDPGAADPLRAVDTGCTSQAHYTDSARTTEYCNQPIEAPYRYFTSG